MRRAEVYSMITGTFQVFLSRGISTTDRVVEVIHIPFHSAKEQAAFQVASGVFRSLRNRWIWPLSLELQQMNDNRDRDDGMAMCARFRSRKNEQ
jgi:hypothetical protein